MTPLQAHYKAAKRLNPESLAALVAAIMPTLPTGVHSRRGVEKIIRCYMGQEISKVSIRVDFKCNDEKLGLYNERVIAFLKDIKESLKLSA